MMSSGVMIAVVRWLSCKDTCGTLSGCETCEVGCFLHIGKAVLSG